MYKKLFFTGIIIFFTISSITANENSKNEWIREEFNKEFNKERHIVREIINNKMLLLKLDPSEKLIIFDEDMPVNVLLTTDLEKYIYTFSDAIFSENEYIYKIYYINNNNKTKEYKIGIGAEAYYSYNRRNKKVKIDGFHVYSHVPWYTKIGYFDNKLVRNFVYTYDSVMAFIIYRKAISEKPLLSTVNQLRIGRRYFADKKVQIEYMINDILYNAKMDGYEFILKIVDGKTVFRQYQIINPNKNLNIESYSDPAERTYAEIEYIGTEIFTNQAGFLRQLPVYNFIGIYKTPSLLRPKYLTNNYSPHSREIEKIGLHFNDYNKTENRGIQKIFDTYSTYGR